jgi:hypothetical protein
MTTELLRQITEISNEIKNIYGNDYGEQYSNVAIKLLNQYPNNMNEYHILIEATHSLIDCDYKDKLIISLQKKIKEQEIRILKLEKNNEIKDKQIINLNNKIEILEKDNKSLNTEISILKKDKETFDALVKLHECNAIVNKVFKNEYKKYFNKKRGEYIPNIGDFINDPPTDNDPDYVFWKIFLTMYPNSDDLQFRNIYYKINNERSLNGAHVDVSMLTENEFDNLMKIIFNDYETNKQLYENYRNWLYKFPIV